MITQPCEDRDDSNSTFQVHHFDFSKPLPPCEPLTARIARLKAEQKEWGIKFQKPITKSQRRNLSRPIHWIGDQWAVTNYGIEHLGQAYLIERDRLFEDHFGRGWIGHMCYKDWVYLDDLEMALKIARLLFPAGTAPFKGGYCDC